jgi:hypothetical protein
MADLIPKPTTTPAMNGMLAKTSSSEGSIVSMNLFPKNAGALARRGQYGAQAKFRR